MTTTNAPYVAASDTSRERATREDRTGVFKARRENLLKLIEEAGTTGLTWKDAADLTGLHHGQVSSVLTRLHENGDVFQLKVTRYGCHPYLVAALKDDFYDYERNDEPVKVKANAKLTALEEVARAARELCYGQSKDAGKKWDALRVALAKVELPNE